MPVKTPAHLLPQLEPLEKKYDADVYMHSGDILHEMPEVVKTEISKTKSMEHSRKNALLILTTLGGYAEPAYQVANMFQRKYNEFYVYNPYYCKSAGTLLSLGANKLIMDEYAEFGPLDVQLPSRKHVNSFRSGAQNMYTFQALGTEVCNLYLGIVEKINKSNKSDISKESAQKIAINLTIGIMQPIYAQIDPHELGSDLRDLSIAIHYGQRLAALSDNLKENTITRLVEGYPSHSFVINFLETRKLFKNVEMAADDFREVIYDLTKYFYTDGLDKLKESDDIKYLNQPFSLTFGLRTAIN